MPYSILSTPSGNIDFHYSIATPASPFSASIDPNLPSILFIHGEYIGQEVFEAQFCDPQLRSRFNLIAVDLRGYGSTGGLVSRDYTPAAAANDVYLFWKALALPPLHVFTVSIGFHVAFQLAHDHSDVVLSLTLCSTMSAEEAEENKIGRQEMMEHWYTLYHGASSDAEREDYVKTLDRAAQRMHYSDYNITPLMNAMTMCANAHAMNNWLGSSEKINNGFVICHDWPVKRKPFTRDFLTKIECPISIIHCDDDLLYTLRDTEELVSQLRDAGHTDVTLTRIPGPHFGHLVSPQFVNPILRDRVLSLCTLGTVVAASATQESSEPLETPFRKTLATCGYMEDCEFDFE